MYLFLALFKEDFLTQGRICLTGGYLEAIKSIFSDYYVLNNVPIKGCIGFLKGKVYADQNCYILRVNSIKADDDSLTILFETEKELDITNQFIDKSLYKFAWRLNWVNKKNKFYPSVCIVEENDFDNIRNGTNNVVKKISSYTSKIDAYKIKQDWASICNMFEPLEKIHENDEIWNNAIDLYNIAFANSKLGEPKNELEKDKQHLYFIKRHRNESIKLFKRCYELEQNDFRYPSSLAYRYYLNVMELTKPKGRRDGNVADEILNAIKWFNEALSLNPNSIKDNYRKGKLIIDKQIPNFKYHDRKWTKDVFEELTAMEAEAIECLRKCIKEYETYTSENQKKRYLNEYVKSLYCLGCYYLEKPKTFWHEYACSMLKQVKYINYMTRKEMDYIVKAKEIFEKCFEVETNIELNINIDARQLADLSKQWVISSMDKVYRIGIVYLHMFFVKLTKHGSGKSTNIYGEKAEAYLNIAKVIGEEYRKLRISGRNTSFISEKLAWYYIFNGDYVKAMKMIEHSKDNYIKNTYSLALMLSNVPNKFNKVETVLKSAGLDNRNKARDLTKVLLAYGYKLSGQEDEYNHFLSDIKEKLNSTGKRLIFLLECDDLYENSCR